MGEREPELQRERTVASDADGTDAGDRTGDGAGGTDDPETEGGDAGSTDGAAGDGADPDRRDADDAPAGGTGAGTGNAGAAGAGTSDAPGSDSAAGSDATRGRRREAGGAATTDPSRRRERPGERAGTPRGRTGGRGPEAGGDELSELRRTPEDDRAERMLAVERRLREEVERHRDAPPADAGPPLRAEVTDAYRDGDRVVFVGVDGAGRELEFDLPWPADPTDRSEPLVRLLDWHDVRPERFADLAGEEVPLRLNADGTPQVHVPPVRAPGNTLWYRTKRWGMRHGFVRHVGEGVVRGRVGSPYSATPLYMLLATAASLLVSTLGLVVLPLVVPIQGLLGWLLYATFVGVPSSIVGTLALVLLPVAATYLGVRGYRWLRRRLFPSA